jgi:CDP-diacylglycerol--serine O-phosphatidyltransferase
MIMDLLDGRVARLMKATSQFGVEYDSLADVISFCVAPRFMIYSFALHALGAAAWFGAFLFVICGALRLARFNVQTRSATGASSSACPRRPPPGCRLDGDPAARARRAAVAVAHRDRHLRAGAADGLDLPLLVVQGVDFAAGARGDLLVVVLAVMIVATMHEVFLFLVFGGYALSGPSAGRGRPPPPRRHRRSRPAAEGRVNTIEEGDPR